MPRDQPHCLREQCLSWFDAMPRRRSGRMRKWNDIELVCSFLHAELFADDFIQSPAGKELRDTEFADGNHQLGFENFDLAIAPIGTHADFITRRHAIAAFGSLAWKT